MDGLLQSLVGLSGSYPVPLCINSDHSVFKTLEKGYRNGGNSYFLYEGGRNEVRKRVGGVQSTFLGTSGFSLKPERSEGFKEATSDQKRHFAHLRPFFRTEFGHPEYRILFFQTTQAFPNPPPHAVSGGTMSRPLPTWPRPLRIATPTSLFLQF